MQRKEATNLAVSLMREHNLVGWGFKLNTNKRTLGVCKYHKKTIELSIYHVDHATDDDIKDTILHEIAHALCGLHAKHGPEWKAMCIRIGAKPERCGGSDSINAPYSYEYICTNCGYSCKRYRRMSKKRACGRCCKQYNGGRYDARFLLGLKLGEFLMSGANHVR